MAEGGKNTFHHSWVDGKGDGPVDFSPPFYLDLPWYLYT